MNPASPLLIAARTTISLAIGGASGAIVNFVTAANGHWNEIDWHKLGITALVGAIVAVAGHYMPPPNQAAVPSRATGQAPEKPGVG
jgi:hypothetical protein